MKECRSMPYSTFHDLMHCSCERVDRVLYAPSEEEGAAGELGVNEGDQIALQFQGQAMKQDGLAIAVVCTMDGCRAVVCLDADGVAVGEFKSDFFD